MPTARPQVDLDRCRADHRARDRQRPGPAPTAASRGTTARLTGRRGTLVYRRSRAAPTARASTASRRPRSSSAPATASRSAVRPRGRGGRVPGPDGRLPARPVGRCACCSSRCCTCSWLGSCAPCCATCAPPPARSRPIARSARRRRVTSRRPGRGTRRSTLDAITTIGRDVNNAIVVDDPFASAEHAVLTFRGRGWYVEDLGSTNGTFVNGRAVEGVAPLGYGDELGSARSGCASSGPADDGSRRERGRGPSAPARRLGAPAHPRTDPAARRDGRNRGSWRSPRSRWSSAASRSGRICDDRTRPGASRGGLAIYLGALAFGAPRAWSSPADGRTRSCCRPWPCSAGSRCC